MSKIRIEYMDVSPGAKENFVATSYDAEQITNLNEFQNYNSIVRNYSNPIEEYLTILDGSSIPIPKSPNGKNIGFLSKRLSDSEGNFDDPIKIYFESVGEHTSKGIMLTFDDDNNIFPTKINVKWYRGIDVISENDYFPESPVFIIENEVENFDGISFVFYSINMPNNRLRFRYIEYGYPRNFIGKELKNVSVDQKIDPISSKISINTVDFSIKTSGNIDYVFQNKQPILAYFDENLISKTFITSASRKSKESWTIRSEDYIGILNEIPFFGGIYENESAYYILTEISNASRVPFQIEQSLQRVFLSGYIPFSNCGDALMQVAFASGYVVDTSNSEFVKIFKLNDESSKIITKNRIMQGQTIKENKKVTGVSLYYHAYYPIEEKHVAYESEKSGIGNNIFVKFSEPLHDLKISNGKIVSRETNFAIINANKNCVLEGKKYRHDKANKTKNNSSVLYGQLENVISIENATLVSETNIDKILDLCYNYLTKTTEIQEKIVERKTDSKIYLGDIVKTETSFVGDLCGIVVDQKYNLNGGIIVKDTQIMA